MLETLLPLPSLSIATLALLILGCFYLLVGGWLLLAPRFFQAPHLIVVSVEQLPLAEAFCPQRNRQQWQRLFSLIGSTSLILCLLAWCWAALLLGAA